MRRTIKWSLACMLILLLAACNSSEPEQVQPIIKEEPVETGQTLTLVEPEYYEVSETSKYQIQTRLTDFQLIHGYGGLAWGVTRNELRLYYTRDSGKTWVNISPSANVKFSSNPVYGKDIFFLDGEHGWIVRSGSDGTNNVVLRTDDGGESWKIASLEESEEVTALYFVSSSHGYLMTSQNSGTLKEQKTIFATTDGGINWEEVSTNNPVQATDDAISLQGYAMGMMFTDENRGLVPVLEMGTPKMFATKDYGQTWSLDKTFFNRTSSLHADCSSFTIGEMESLSLSHNKLYVPLGCSEGNSVKYSGLFTKDSGDSWSHVEFDLPAESGVNKRLYPTFVSDTTGWMLIGKTVYHTIDQGKTWSTLAESKTLVELLNEYPEVVKMQFVTTKVGWILLENASKKKSILIQTTDGGVNWGVL
ncbi:YCF48-related protein [Paenibacillus sp. Marseille-Q4541]|uniref:YCF48-related protein n=1 Tax=Paenibacillus sp. Marseille-Q4541 TaxID=2831522 RepID=UPI001BA8A44F|nr:YCF48-related protein [Paenibacillus sp. Marseille-Q4541]